METGKMKESGTTRGRKKELHCPECGGIVARAGKGTNAVFRCPKCKRDVDYTGLTLSMELRES